MDINSKFSLKLNDFDSSIRTVWKELREEGDFCDVTLACEGKQIEAHKVILSRFSPVFKNLLKQNPHPHPLFYLMGVKYCELVNILDFIYQGEISIDQEHLHSFLDVSRDFQIKGLICKDFQIKTLTEQEGRSNINLKRCVGYDGGYPSPKKKFGSPSKGTFLDNFHEFSTKEQHFDILNGVEGYAKKEEVDQYMKKNSGIIDFDQDVNKDLEFELDGVSTEIGCGDEKVEWDILHCSLKKCGIVDVVEDASEVVTSAKKKKSTSGKKTKKKVTKLKIRTKTVLTERLKCKDCTVTFRTVQGRKYHQLKAHGSATTVTLECQECGWQTFRHDLLDNHYRSAHDQPLIECSNNCGKQFVSIYGEKRHLKQCIQKQNSDSPKKTYEKTCDDKKNSDGTKRSFVCPTCGKNFAMMASLLDHEKRKHQGISNELFCHKCSKKIKHAKNMKRHLMACGKESSKPEAMGLMY